MRNEPKRPWKVSEAAECFIVEDAHGIYRIAYLYFEDENPTRRSDTKRLTKEVARRIADEIAGLTPQQ